MIYLFVLLLGRLLYVPVQQKEQPLSLEPVHLRLLSALDQSPLLEPYRSLSWLKEHR